MAPQTPVLQQSGRLKGDPDGGHLQPSVEDDLTYASTSYLIHTPLPSLTSIPNPTHTSMPTLILSPMPTLLPTSMPTLTPAPTPTLTETSTPTFTEPSSRAALTEPSIPTLTDPSRAALTEPSIPIFTEPSRAALTEPSRPTLTEPSPPTLTEPSPPSFVQCPATVPTPSPTESNKTEVTESLNVEADVLVCLGRRASSASSCSYRTPTPGKPDMDGGWAWVVFVAAFLQFFVSSGMYYSFSVFFVELLRTFGESRAKTAWVYSTNSAVHMFCGPLGGWVISRWGPRAAVMLGGLLAGLGNIMTAFAPSLDVIFFTHGFVNAVGTSLNFCGWIVGLGRFWERRHALAVGLAMSGSGFGVFFLGPLLESIVQEYGWRGAMLICAGMSFNFSVFGATIYSKKRKQTPIPKGIYRENQHLVVVDDVGKAVTDCDIQVETSDDSFHKSETSESEGSLILKDTDGTLPPLVAAASAWSLVHHHRHTRRLQNWLSSLGSTLKSYTKYKNRLKDKQSITVEGTKRRLLCSPTFWLLEASCFLSFMATTTMYAVFLDWTTWAGMSTAFSAALAGSGAGDLIGRMLAGALMGRDLPPLLLFSGIQTLLAAAIGFASIASTPEQLVSAMVAMGVACGLQSVLSALIPSQLSSGIGVGRVLGYLLLVSGAGALSGPPIAGVLVDQTESYAPVLILCATSPAVAAVLNLVAHCTSRRFRRHSSPQAAEQRTKV